MAPTTVFVRRGSSLSTSTELYIAGFSLVGALVGGLLLWLLVRFCKNRMNEKRDEKRGAAFLHVRGVMKEGEKSNTLNELRSVPKKPGRIFSYNT